MHDLKFNCFKTKTLFIITQNHTSNINHHKTSKSFSTTWLVLDSAFTRSVKVAQFGASIWIENFMWTEWKLGNTKSALRESGGTMVEVLLRGEERWSAKGMRLTWMGPVGSFFLGWEDNASLQNGVCVRKLCVRVQWKHFSCNGADKMHC